MDGSEFPFDDRLRHMLVTRLQAFPTVQLPEAGRRRAAVVVLIVPDDEGQASLVLTRRASKLGTNPGQWAFPGGRVDEGEPIVSAGLRELHEEVGVAAGADNVLGRLDDYGTRSGYVISPLVVWGGAEPDLSPNPAEVASIHLARLIDLRPEPRFISIPESDRPVIQVPLFGKMVHAPTAAVLYQVREVVLYDRVTRVGHLEQPVFTWR